MAISLTHTTVAVGTNAGNGEIAKEEWNENHTLTLAENRLLGRTTAGTGAVEEISAGTGLTLSGGSLSVTTNTYQPLDSELTALAGLASAADRLPYFTGSGTAALATFTGAARNLLDDASATDMRTTLSAAGSGAVTSSGLTMATARLLGRTTASTGAVEELTAGRGLSLSAGSLAAAAGTVLQVVTAKYSTEASNNTLTLADTGLTATITPSSTSSKILVIVSQSYAIERASNSSNGYLKLLRGTTVIFDSYLYMQATGATFCDWEGVGSLVCLDSPASVSAQTYKTQFKLDNTANSAIMYVQRYNFDSTITLLEVAG